MDKRVILINIDGLGVGNDNNFPDINTIKNLTNSLVCFLPNLNSLGLKKLYSECNENDVCYGCYSSVSLMNKHYDDFWGQWELVGIDDNSLDIIKFEDEVDQNLREYFKSIFKREVLCCKRMLGVNALAEYGRLSFDTNSPICYISDDNTLNFCCHENLYSHSQLNEIIKELQKGCSDYIIEKICTRVFAGKNNSYYNIDQPTIFISKPNQKTIFEKIIEKQTVSGIGKIDDYFNREEFSEIFSTRTNELSLKLLIKQMQVQQDGLIYVNLFDFDKVFAKRADMLGMRKCLEEVDSAIGLVLRQMKQNDILVITSSHGVDIMQNNVEVRQQVPVLICGESLKNDIKIKDLSMCDIGEMVYCYFMDKKDNFVLKQIAKENV